MKLSVLLEEITVNQLIGSDNASVLGITDDSRLTGQNYLYVAVPGLTNDGHRFIPEAISRGSSVIVAEYLPQNVVANVTYVIVDNSADALGKLASAFHGHPSHHMKVIGVTGTDGKTTIATLLHKIAAAQGYKAGLLSTICNVIVDESVPTSYTTLNAVKLQTTLATMYEAGCEYVFMEVSSHAVSQRRIAGMTFSGGIFTNLTNCHLDYHDTMEAYCTAKQRFFNELPSNSFFLTNADDSYGSLMANHAVATPFTYSLDKPSDYSATVVVNELTGLKLTVKGYTVETGLVGRFNAYNVTAAFAASQLLGFDAARTINTLRNITPVEGRFDWILAHDGRIGIVDYAHTPNALTNVLQTTRDVLPGRRIVIVIGCQGEPHDKKKRPIMGGIASGADCAIFTNMNPRWEEPGQIFGSMLDGVSFERRDVVRIVPDRGEAIRLACKLAGPGGVVLVPGRGHVRYHHVRDQREPFYDKDVLKNALEAVILPESGYPKLAVLPQVESTH